MASESDPAPYFEDMFDILSKTPQERLMSLKYKLPVDRKIDRLLYSAVLFFLNEKEKAVLLVSDDKEQKCQSAVYILNKIQGTEQGANSKFGWDNLTPEDLAVRVDLARIFTVLSQENLCESSVKDRAYRAAVHSYRSSGQIDSVEFWDLLDESRRQCGCRDFNSKGEDANRPFLKSLDENSLSTRSGSDCRSRVETVRNRTSTDPMISSGVKQITLPSHFEISATSTVPFLSGSPQDNLKSKAKGPAERGLVPSTSQSASFHINNTASNLPREEHSANSRNTTGTGAQPEEGYSTYSPVKNSSAVGVKPIECTEETDSNQIVTSKTSTQDQDHLNSNLSDPHPTQNATLSEDPQSSRPRMNISEETEENVENKFYPFVILHADEDQEIAEKVRKSLEELGVMEGATFCEDFSLPGKCPISCIQDAVDNSAFTILLLTNNFNTHWTELKTNIVLMNSIQNKHKYNTVIPMLTKENRLPKRKIPFALQAINQLDETSKHFERHVAKTFEPAKLRTYKDKWLVEQKLQQIETQKAKVAKDRKDLRDITRLTQQLGQNLQNYQKEGQHLASLRQYCNALYNFPNLPPIPSPYPGQMRPPMGHEQMLPMLYPFGIQGPGQFPPDPRQYGFNPHMHTPREVLNPSNGQGAQSVTINNSPMHPNQPPNIIQIHHVSNVQIGDSNQLTIADSGKSDGSTDEEEEEEEEEADDSDN
eukprot:gi/632966223/ref/XP_007899298.1/ PREDICTED: TIR domain-containing adapter molecule 1 [Callorhinchus milii]